MRRPDGSLHWMRTRARRLSQAADGGGEVVGYVLNVEAEYRATAERQAAEAREAAALRAAQARLERLHAGLPAVIIHRDAAPDGTSRLLYRGGDVAAVTGWSAVELAGHDSLDHLDGHGARPVDDMVREVLRAGSARHDWQLRRPDGSLHWMRVQLRLTAPRPDGGGEVVGYVVDADAEIRAAREANAALRREAAALEEGRAQVARLHAALPAVLFHRDVAADGRSRLVYRGGDIEAVTGWPAATLADDSRMDALVVGGAATFAGFEAQVLRDGTGRLDWRMRAPDGTPRWLRSQARRLVVRPDGGGEVVGHVLDVSAGYAAAAAAEQARAREAAALQEGRAQMERLQAGLPVVIYHRDAAADGSSVLLHRGGDLEAVFGRPAAELAARDDFNDLLGPGSLPMAEVVRRVLAAGSSTNDWSLRQPDGGLRWLRTEARLIRARPDGGGEVVGYIQDITAERAARAREAAALEAGRAQVERLHAGMPLILFHRDCAADGSSDLLYRGGDYLAVTGWPESAFDRNAFTRIYAPETPPFTEFIAATLRDGSGTLDWRARQPDGGWRWLRNFARRLTQREDGGGEVVGYVVDVHAEHLAAERAAAAAADLDRTLGLAPVVVFRGRLAPAGDLTRTYLSRGIERLTGHPWAQVNAPGGLRALLEEDQHDEAPLMQRLLAAGELGQDLRLRHADGHWLWMRETMAIVERYPNGGGEMIGFLTDVTAERAAQASVADLDRAFAAAPVAVYRARRDADGALRRTYLSRGIEKLTGWLWTSFEGRSGALRALMEFESEADEALVLRPPEPDPELGPNPGTNPGPQPWPGRRRHAAALRRRQPDLGPPHRAAGAGRRRPPLRGARLPGRHHRGTRGARARGGGAAGRARPDRAAADRRAGDAVPPRLPGRRRLPPAVSRRRPRGGHRLAGRGLRGPRQPGGVYRPARGRQPGRLRRRGPARGRHGARLAHAPAGRPAALDADPQPGAVAPAGRRRRGGRLRPRRLGRIRGGRGGRGGARARGGGAAGGQGADRAAADQPAGDAVPPRRPSRRRIAPALPRRRHRGR